MNKQELEKKLANGTSYGFIKETDDDNYLGWVLITKLQPIIIYDKKSYDEEHYLHLLKKQEAQKKYPYFVRIIELLRDVHESEVYATLDEVEEFITELGYSFDNIKDRWEIDAP
jgi:hypothetical protein